MKTTIATVGAVAATVMIGAVAADPGSAWYRSLRKPRWQPPPPAYQTSADGTKWLATGLAAGLKPADYLALLATLDVTGPGS